MALQTLKTLRSLLRSRIAEEVQDKFSNIELNTILSLGQFDVSRRLLKINKSWLATSATLTITAGVATLPSDCGEIESIVASDLDNYGVFVELPLSAVGSTENKFNKFRNSAGCGYYVQIGSSVKFICDLTEVTLPSTVTLYYIQKPVEISDDADETIIPVQFVDLLLAYGEWHCAHKAGLNPDEKKVAYNQMFEELRKSVERDIERATPGVGK